MFLFFYDTMMMVAETTKTCRWIFIYDKILMGMGWFVMLYKYSLIHGYGAYKNYVIICGVCFPACTTSYT